MRERSVLAALDSCGNGLSEPRGRKSSARSVPSGAAAPAGGAGGAEGPGAPAAAGLP